MAALLFPLEALWKRNNLYVLHNKIYYKSCCCTRCTRDGDGSADIRTYHLR